VESQKVSIVEKFSYLKRPAPFPATSTPTRNGPRLQLMQRPKVLCPKRQRNEADTGNVDICAARQIAVYSITSSASASNLSGISRPSALAVLTLITSSNFVGSRTGKIARLLSRSRAASGRFGVRFLLSYSKHRSVKCRCKLSL
jgi:hypothetical protein